MSKTLVISITIPDGVTVDVQRGPVDGVAIAQQVFQDDLEDLGPIPTPPNEPTAFRGAAMQQPQQQQPTMPNGPQFPPFGTNPAVASQWQAGQIHAAGHKPLKPGNYGVYCPTKLGTDATGKAIYCDFKP